MEPILTKLRKGDMDALRKLEDIAMPDNIEELTAQMRAEINLER